MTKAKIGSCEMKEEEFTSSFAWATLVMQNELYVCGALVLGQSLRNNHSRASMICMVTDDVTREYQQALEDVWDFVVVVPKIVAAKPVQQRTQTRFGHMYRPWLQNCLTKFNILQMVHLQKICFLDSDMLCLSNPDDLFECRTPAGVCDSLRFTIDAQDLWHGRHLPEAEVRNALNGHHYGIAGSLLLLEPSLEVFDEIRHLAAHSTIGQSNAMAGPDEYFITDFFLKKGVRWTHVHKRYSCISWAVEKSLGGKSEPVFLHFVSEKPWLGPSEVTGNWPDFAMWDEVAATVEHLAPSLFRNWKVRNKQPVTTSRAGLGNPRVN